MCKICSWTYFSPPFPKKAGWDPNNESSQMGYWHDQAGSPLARENDFSEFQKCIRVNRKGTK